MSSDKLNRDNFHGIEIFVVKMKHETSLLKVEKATISDGSLLGSVSFTLINYLKLNPIQIAFKID